jgi:hypothetical protein
MKFANGRAKTGGRRPGSLNKRTIAAAYPDAFGHLVKVMATTDDPTITPELRLRAAIVLVPYQHSKQTYLNPLPYAAQKTVEEARALLLELGERLMKGEIPIEAHDALVNGIRAFLSDKAAEQEKILARLEASQRGEGS